MSEDSRVTPFRSRSEDSREHRAAEWLAKLDRGSLSREERDAFGDWLAEDARNKESIQELAGFWYGIDLSVANVLPAGDNRKPMLLRPGFAVAAMVVLAIAIVYLTAPFDSAPGTVEETAKYETGVGEIRLVNFTDGSNMHLNTGSTAEQHYSDELRQVSLFSGEAVFDVAHDDKRPFIVKTPDGEIRAVGTRFSVRIDDDAVAATVTEGTIAVTAAPIATPNGKPAQVANPPLLVERGEAVSLSKAQGRTKRFVSDRDVLEQLSWVNGQLVFFDRSIESVIEEVMRYTSVEIVIVDDELKSKPKGYTGMLPIGDVDAMLDGIEFYYDIEVRWVSENRVEIFAG